MLSYKNRFHGRSGIRYVYLHGNVVRTRLLTCKYVSNPHRKDPRIAVVISKKVLKSAVGRNRIRRRIYEYMRERIDKLPANSDIVLIVGSAELRTMSTSEVGELMDQILSQANLYKAPEN
jgi:ribonuclease P protein component